MLVFVKKGIEFRYVILFSFHLKVLSTIFAAISVCFITNNNSNYRAVIYCNICMGNSGLVLVINV